MERLQVAHLRVDDDLHGHGVNLGGEIDQVVGRYTLAFEGWRLRGERLRRGRHVARYRRRRQRALLDRPHRIAGRSVENVSESLLRHLRDRFDPLAVDGHIDEIECGWIVVVPQAVVHHLRVPDPLAGFDVECHEAFDE